MERPITLKPLSIREETAPIHSKKIPIGGKSKPSKAGKNKAGAATESRKALIDITNKSAIRHGASSQKKNSENRNLEIQDEFLRSLACDSEAIPKTHAPKNVNFDIPEEGFLHDHNKCVGAQENISELDFLNIVLPGHDSRDLVIQDEKAGPEPECPLHLEELPEEKFLDWFISSWKSPPSSPKTCDSPPPPPFISDIDHFELILKADDAYD